jgi:hypothetical protein
LYIYDFDRAAVSRRSVVAMQQPYLINSGNCPSFHPKRDFLKQICNIYSSLKWLENQGDELPLALRTFRSQMMLRMVLDDALEDEIKESDSRCWLQSKTGGVSTLCRDDQLATGLAEPADMVQWMLDQTAYRRFPLTAIAQNGDVFQKFRQQIPATEPAAVREYLAANTQFLCRNNTFGAWREDPQGMQRVLTTMYAAMD